MLRPETEQDDTSLAGADFCQRYLSSQLIFTEQPA
jgi:hypothetical protein